MIRCNYSPRCKSTECVHATTHEPIGTCDRSAPCAIWPCNRNFQPIVTCIPEEKVKPLQDCPNCGKFEEYGHHFGDCINTLKFKLSLAEQRLKDSESANAELRKRVEEAERLAKIQLPSVHYTDEIIGLNQRISDLEAEVARLRAIIDKVIHYVSRYRAKGYFTNNDILIALLSGKIESVLLNERKGG